MNKKDLIALVAETHGMTLVAAKEVVGTILGGIQDTLVDGGTVDLSGFGKFTPKHREAREGFNPITKERIQIAASRSVGFKPAKALKDAVNI